MYATYNYSRSSSNSFHAKITEFFHIKKVLQSFIKCAMPPWLAAGLWNRKIIWASFLLALWKNIQIAWIIRYWKMPFLILDLYYTFSFDTLKSCNKLLSLWMLHVSIFLPRAIYSRWDTQRVIITLWLVISFCLQVLSTGSKEMMVLCLLLFLTENSNFYYIILPVHLHWIGQNKTEYCLQLRYQPRSWEVRVQFPSWLQIMNVHFLYK